MKSVALPFMGPYAGPKAAMDSLAVTMSCERLGIADLLTASSRG
jgi:hypothetical protein